MEMWKTKGTTIAAGLFLLCSLAAMCISGGNLIQAVYFWMLLPIYVLLPGFFWYRALRLDRELSQIQGMLTLLLGVGFFSLCYCFAGRFGMVWLLRLLPLPFAAGGLYALGKDGFNDCKEKLSRVPGWMWCLWGFCCLMFTMYISVPNADPTVVGQSWLNQDLLWNVGNAESFKMGFPPQDIRFAEVRLSYHYLTELFVGALSWTSGISAYRIFAFYMGFPVLAAVLFCVYELGMVLYQQDRRKTGLLCGMTIFAGCASFWVTFSDIRGIFWNTMLVHLVSNINSQATAVIQISIFMALLTILARREFRVSLQEYLVFLASVFLMTFGKGPEAAIVMCAFTIALLIVLVFQRPKHPVSAVLLLAGSLLVFCGIYFAVFSSGAQNSVIISDNTLKQSVFGPALEKIPLFTRQRQGALFLFGLCLVIGMQPLQVLIYLATLPRDIMRVVHLSLPRLIARGAAVGGLVAYLIFWHRSSSQVYFAFVAFYFMNLLTADVLPDLQHKLSRWLAGGLLAVGVISAVFLYSGITYRGGKMLASYLGWGTVNNEAYGPVTAGDVEAMEWLQKNMPETDRFATNRIHMAPWRDDGISNVYSAFSGRQAYMEGYIYACTNEGVSDQLAGERMTCNAAIFDPAMTQEQLQAACAHAGVNWLIYSIPYPGSDEQFTAFEKVYENPDVRIYHIPELAPAAG